MKLVYHFCSTFDEVNLYSGFATTLKGFARMEKIFFPLISMFLSPAKSNSNRRNSETTPRKISISARRKPIHFLAPIEKGITWGDFWNFPSLLRCLFGSNLSESGHMFSSWCRWKILDIRIEPFGMWYPSTVPLLLARWGTPSGTAGRILKVSCRNWK